MPKQSHVHERHTALPRDDWSEAREHTSRMGLKRLKARSFASMSGTEDVVIADGSQLPPAVAPSAALSASSPPPRAGA
eukprot:5697253-Alexandrium_andersonii.AAC.1